MDNKDFLNAKLWRLHNLPTNLMSPQSTSDMFDKLLTAQTLITILKRVEWGYENICPDCGEPREDGHASTCRLNYVLTKLNKNERIPE